MKNRSVFAFASVLMAGFAGMLIDSNIGFDGNFSVVAAIAVASAFLVKSGK